MPAKRKDKKGRVPRTGENQRKDLAYQYHYQDVTGKRRTVYAPTLEELRAKEDEINKAQDSGVDYNAGNVTVLELLERCIRLKLGVRTHATYGHAQDITATFAGRGAPVGLTHKHNAYTIWPISYVNLHQFTKLRL